MNMTLIGVTSTIFQSLNFYMGKMSDTHLLVSCGDSVRQ